MNASVNASLPSCINVLSAHGLTAVLHLSKDKKTSLGGRKKATPEKLSRPSRLLIKKMKNGFIKMVLPDGSTDVLIARAI